MIKIDCEQGSEQWFQNRLGRITGSRFATIMMGTSTKGFKDLISTIAGEIISGEMEETYSNDIMERGKELEPEARKLYEQIFEIEVEQTGLIIPNEDDPLHEYIGYSPDGLPPGGLYEIKCPLFKTHIQYIENGVLPNDYKWQVQGGIWVTGLPWCDFMSYYPNAKPFIIRVFPDIKMHKALREQCEFSVDLIKQKIKLYETYDYFGS